jgi:hypothetical protein
MRVPNAPVLFLGVHTSSHRHLVHSKPALYALSLACSLRVYRDKTFVELREVIEALTKGPFVSFDFGQPELIAQLAQQMYSTDLLLLIQNIARFDFEAQKDVVQIFSGVRSVPYCQQ